MTLPRVSIIVPLYNKARFVEACLSSLLDAAEAYGNAEVIVVDNGSTDGSREIVESGFGGRLRLFTLTGATIGAVRNFGTRQASGEYLSFIDADCVVPRNYFFSLVEVMKPGKVEVTGCQVGLPPSPSWVEQVWHGLHWVPGDRERSYINSGNLALTRRAFETVGGFAETLPTGEDAEICQRLSDAGFSIYESKKLMVIHLDNPRTLRAFFRKELWRGLGMFGTVRWTSVDKPTAMLLVHLAALVTAACVIVLGPIQLWARVIAALMLVAAVPCAAVGYRVAGGAKLRDPIRGFALYELYFMARAAALVRIAAEGIGRLAPPRGGGGDG